MLANAAGISVISKFKTLKMFDFSTFIKMYHSHVVPITDYSAGIWGYLKSVEGEKIWNRLTRVYFEVHKQTQFSGIWVFTRTKVRHNISQIRMWNGLIQMPSERLTI